MLGNTPAICCKCYIHPAIFNGYLDDTLLETIKQRSEEKLADPGDGLRAEEAAVVGFQAHQLEHKDDREFARGGTLAEHL